MNRKGALCDNEKLQATIFEDHCSHESYLKALRRNLLHTLKASGCDHVIVQQWGKMGIVPENLHCDYYDWCNGKRMGIVWHGEYMVQLEQIHRRRAGSHERN